tara:strand:+ start:188 stop:1171 length:984 start_codon:yes stop_codon:yes gene_type:complete
MASVGEIFGRIGNVVSDVASGVGNLIGDATKYSTALQPTRIALQAISNLFDEKDSGNQAGTGGQFGGGGSSLGSFTPEPIETTTNTGAGVFAGGNSFLGSSGFLQNQGSGSSLIPAGPALNQNQALETAQSSIQTAGLGNLVPFAAPRIGQFLSGAAKLGELFTSFQQQTPQFEQQRQFNLPPTTPFNLIGGNMAFGIGGQGALSIPQATPMQGSAFMSPVLGRIGISSKGNIIITRRLRNQFKALADNVGLAQASNLAGVPIEIGAMILTKRFSTRGKSISSKKMQDCARTYKRITHFYNMIPKRTATRTTKSRTMRGASTVIQNS